MYLEDDIRVSKENIVYWLNARKALKIYNLIPSFVRTEINFKDNLRGLSLICSISKPTFVLLIIIATKFLECEMEMCCPLSNSGTPNSL